MNNAEPTYSFDEVVDLLATLSRDKTAVEILEQVVAEEKKRYCLQDLWILQLLFEYART